MNESGMLHLLLFILFASRVFSAPPFRLTSTSNPPRNDNLTNYPEWPAVPFSEALHSPGDVHFKLTFTNAFVRLPSFTSRTLELLQNGIDVAKTFPPSGYGPAGLDMSDPDQPVWIGCVSPSSSTTGSRISWTIETLLGFLETLKDLVTKYGFQEFHFELIFEDSNAVTTSLVVAECSLLQQPPMEVGGRSRNGTLPQSSTTFS